MIAGMQDYYRRRAPIYDASMGYDQPEVLRQHEQVIEYIVARVAKRTVLEIACGPGFWTQFLMRSAAEITATDFNEETLVEARKKNLAANVKLQQADAYTLPDFERAFDACFAGDWFCHVPIAKRRDFLDGLHARLRPGAVVIFCDQLPREGSRGDAEGAEGDNVQTRTLADGGSYAVIKNFPGREEFERLLLRYTTEVKVVEFPESRRYVVEYHLDK